ncbi:MAG: hypothetical protein KF690_12540, partial [Bacteroidetes bacterium]|nr:hypothetical protein [Bacteroidota bacterium]
RLYTGDVAADGCGALSLYDTWRNRDFVERCLPAGKYTLQLIGRTNKARAHENGQSNLGRIVTTTLTVGQEFASRFGLHADGEVDYINAGAPLQDGVLYYATRDTFDCRTTILPTGYSSCVAGNDRAIYRVVQIDRDGILWMGGNPYDQYYRGVRYRLFRGNANDLATAYTAADDLLGLVDQMACQTLYNTAQDAKVCVTPGYYTLVAYANVSLIGYSDRPYFQFQAYTPTLFSDPANPQVLPNLSAGGPSVTGTPSTFSCDDNPNTLIGYTPCSGYTKMVYREIYVEDPLLVTMTFSYLDYRTYSDGSATHRVFRGRVSDGSLSSLFRDCGGTMSNVCMSPGWYTIVSYGRGEDYITPAYTVGRGYSVGDRTNVSITYDPDVQRFSTFETRDTTHRDNPIFWEPRGTHTAQIPHLYKSVTLQTENFDCGLNTPFPTGITPCNAAHNRISYRVFTLTKPSYVYISNLRPSGRSYQS